LKVITNNVRNDDAIAIVHLFEFDMYNFDNTFDETLRFTDSEIFITSAGNEYTPLSITFDRLNEDFSMATDSISLAIDNINGALTTKALASEWRNNNCRIVRVVYTPKSSTISGDEYEYGIADSGSETYPNMNFDTDGITFDAYVLFQGVIDTFSATSQALQGTLTTQFTHWAKPFPPRTYSQDEFTSIIDAMTEDLYWGRLDPDE
jgi:hypothetical protein